MDLNGFDYLTFDCYGTLIDWESGILAAVHPLLAAHGLTIDDERVLSLFADIESSVQAERYRPYRQVLAEVVRGFGNSLGFKPSEQECESLAESVGSWSPFDDTVEALKALKRRYGLAVISNIDDDLFAESARRLGVEFDEVVTAQQVGSYKPSHENFLAAFERLGRGPDRILHVAQSLFHDIGPARELGLPCVWVNRRAGRGGSGATAHARAEPDLEVPDLESLTVLMGLD